MAATVGPASRPRTVTCVEEHLDGEIVLWCAATRQMHHLNAVAAIIWGELDGARTLEQVAGTLGTMTTNDPDVVLAAVVNTVQTLAAESLLQTEGN